MKSHREAWKKAVLAISIWLSHVVVILAVLASFRLIEWCMHYLWGLEGRALFDKVPISYLFDGADAAVLVGLFFYGVYWITHVYRWSN